MGSRRRRRSSSKTTTNSGSAGGNMDQAMEKLPPVSAKDSNSMYTGILGGQLGAMGDTLGGLIENGQKMMSGNPAMANFVRAVGGQPVQFETPDFLFGLADKFKSEQPQPAAPAQQPQQEPQWLANLPPEMKRRYYAQQGQSPYTFDVNNYMRDQNLGGQGGR